RGGNIDPPSSPRRSECSGWLRSSGSKQKEGRPLSDGPCSALTTRCTQSGERPFFNVPSGSLAEGSWLSCDDVGRAESRGAPRRRLVQAVADRETGGAGPPTDRQSSRRTVLV